VYLSRYKITWKLSLRAAQFPRLFTRATELFLKRTSRFGQSDDSQDPRETLRGIQRQLFSCRGWVATCLCGGRSKIRSGVNNNVGGTQMEIKAARPASRCLVCCIRTRWKSGTAESIPIHVEIPTRDVNNLSQRFRGKGTVFRFAADFFSVTPRITWTKISSTSGLKSHRETVVKSIAHNVRLFSAEVWNILCHWDHAAYINFLMFLETN